MTKVKIFTLALILSITFVPITAAQFQAEPADFREEIELQPTDMGRSLSAFGISVRASKNGVQLFGVRVFGDFRDGSVLEVTVTTENNRTMAGAITTFLGSGSLLLESSTHGSEVFPVESLRNVYVSYRGEKLMIGQFRQRSLGE